MIRRILLAVALCAAAPAFLAPVPAAHAQTNTIQMEHISVEVLGEGSPVILIPGLSTPREVWADFVPALAAKHRVYLVQVNGFGGDVPRGNLTAGVLARVVGDLHVLVALEKLKGAAVIGHSMGGLAGLMWARAYPGDFAKLMIVDSLPYAGALFVPNATVAMVEPQAAAIRDQMLGSYGKPADPAQAGAVSTQLALKPESQAKVRAWMLASDPRVSGLALYDDLTTDMRPQLASITTPITLLYPWSARMPKANADAFYQGEYAKTPHITYVPVGDSAHFIMLDQPEAFRAALAAFLGE